jgi:hypothetical protein
MPERAALHLKKRLKPEDSSYAFFVYQSALTGV